MFPRCPPTFLAHFFKVSSAHRFKAKGCYLTANLEEMVYRVGQLTVD